MPEAKSPKPVEFRPRPEKIRDLIHRLAADTRKILWTPHAHERMAERESRTARRSTCCAQGRREA